MSQESDKETVKSQSDKDGVSENRRRLMRAGLAAAPVVMTLKSRSVLATGGGHNCIKPSAFSSLQAAQMHLSRPVQNDFMCLSPGYWKAHNHPVPYSIKSKSFFLAVPPGAPSGSVTAGFSPDSGGQFVGKTLQQVLDMGGGGIIAIARHTVGTFLTAVSYGDDPTKVLLTTFQCKQLWSALAVGGSWSPFPGANWNLVDTLAYFDHIYG